MPDEKTLTLPREDAEEFESLAQKTGMSASELMRELLEAYRARAEIEEFRSLQEYGARRAREAGLTSEEDVVRLVREARREERERSSS